MPPFFRRASARALSTLPVLLLAFSAACEEREVGTQACPALCPDQTVVVKDTTFEVGIADTTLTGFPIFGIEAQLVVANVSGTLDTRAFLRFDSLQTVYLPPGFTVDSAVVGITNPDSARLFFNVDTAHSKVPASFTINAYSVDTTIVDSLTSVLVGMMVPGRLIGSRTFTTPEFLDTISIPIDSAKMRAIIAGPGRLRVGLQVVAPGQPAVIRLLASESQSPPRLIYKAAPDSGATTVALLPRALTPLLYSTAQASFADWTEIVVGAPPVAPNTMVVGGMPARRPVITFTLPAGIVDSSEVVRATLTLTQVPDHPFRDTDSVAIYPLVAASTANVTDQVRAIQFAQPLFGAIRLRYSTGAWTDSLGLVPRDSGRRKIELTAVLREWRINAALLRRIIALRVGDEGFTGAGVRFFSSSAPTGLRPSIRILYVPAPKRVTP